MSGTDRRDQGESVGLDADVASYLDEVEDPARVSTVLASLPIAVDWNVPWYVPGWPQALHMPESLPRMWAQNPDQLWVELRSLAAVPFRVGGAAVLAVSVLLNDAAHNEYVIDGTWDYGSRFQDVPLSRSTVMTLLDRVHPRMPDVICQDDQEARDVVTVVISRSLCGIVDLLQDRGRRGFERAKPYLDDWVRENRQQAIDELQSWSG